MMDTNKTSGVPIVEFPTAGSYGSNLRREIDLQDGDDKIVYKAIKKLDESRLGTEELFEVFNDWQTKKTLTSKRVFVSTSLLVAAASWVGVNYTELTLFGLKLSNNNPERIISFTLVSIIMSGIFYEVSRRIDAGVRNARISYIDRDLKELKEPMRAIREVMERNNVPSFPALYYDLTKTSVTALATKHDARHVFRAMTFYEKNLLSAGKGLSFITTAELLLIYLIALYAIISLLISLK